MEVVSGTLTTIHHPPNKLQDRCIIIMIIPRYRRHPSASVFRFLSHPLPVVVCRGNNDENLISQVTACKQEYHRQEKKMTTVRRPVVVPVRVVMPHTPMAMRSACCDRPPTCATFLPRRRPTAAVDPSSFRFHDLLWTNPYDDD